jgi:hypothetical protein
MMLMLNERHHGIVACLACLSVLLAGCTTTRSTPVGSTAASNSDLTNRPAATRTTRVVAEIVPWGSIEYDRQTLPLVSPDGRFMVTQTRIAPTWPTLLAQRDAQIPVATRIQIHRLDASTRSLEFVRNINAPVVLGRSVNAEGFLVESPQADGSRWIGLVGWETGEIRWLVADTFVNAFASLGPDDRLAWSRRAVDDPEHQFELAVRHGETEWTHRGAGESWLMPIWSWRGDGLFALVMSDDRLDAAYMIASDTHALQQSMRTIHLAQSASVAAAYQTIGAHVSSPADRGPDEQFVFHHPARAAMAVWRPRSSAVSPVALFDMHTFAAVIDDDRDYALVTTEQRLIRQHLRQPRDRRELLGGIHVVRPTLTGAMRYVLLSPRDDSVAVMSISRER